MMVSSLSAICTLRYIAHLIFDHIYQSPMDLRECNVFTGVCLSTGEGRVSLLPGPFWGEGIPGGPEMMDHCSDRCASY